MLDVKVDIIVKFRGANSQMPLLPHLVFPDELLRIYNRKLTRTLIRLGHTTRTIRDESTHLVSHYARIVKDTGLKNMLGSIFILGSSSGGRNALDLAASLTSEGIDISYVGAMDAAFFPNETNDRPQPIYFSQQPANPRLQNSTIFPKEERSSYEPGNTPTFIVFPVKAAVKENYYQTAGNHTDKDNLIGERFGSSMGGKEIHGKVRGFINRDFSLAVARKTSPTDRRIDDTRHSLLIQEAIRHVHTNICLMLNRLP